MANGLNGLAYSGIAQRGRRKVLFKGLPNVQVFQNGAGTRSEIFRARVPEQRAYILLSGTVPIMKFYDTEDKPLSHTARLAWGVYRAEEDYFPVEIAQLDYSNHAELDVKDQLISTNQDSLRLTIRDGEGRDRGAVVVVERQIITVSIEAPSEIDWNHPETVFKFEVREVPLSALSAA